MKVALIQITSVLDYKKNLEKLEELLQIASDNGAVCAFLPECFYSMSDGKKPTPHLVKFQNEHYENIKALAVKFNLYLIGGTAATLSDGVIVNRAYNFSPSGDDLGYYDKRKLFSCDIIKDGKRKKVDESDVYTAGNISKTIEVMGWKIGLGICFDIRFSNLSYDYRKEDIDILTYSSAFTVPTGRAHWHLLNRARAIESQCFVISAAQWGKNSSNVRTYGHSLIVNPWGDIVSDLKEGQSVSIIELEKSEIEDSRRKIIM